MLVSFVLSQECNLDCSYCFEGEKSDPKVIDFDHAVAWLERLPDNLSIDFYGGEPLLQIPLIRRIIDWARLNGRTFRYTVTTNGQIVDEEFIDCYLKDFHRIKISVDGPKEVHDRNRGPGTFDKAMTLLSKLNERSCSQAYLSPTFTKHDVSHLASIAKWFLDVTLEYGIARQKFVLNIGDRLEWDEKDYATYEEQLRLIIGWYDALPPHQKDVFFINCLENARYEEPRLIHYFMACSAGHEAFAVSPHGEVLPCVTEAFTDPSLRHQDLGAIPAKSVYSQLTMKEDYPDCFECDRYACGPCPALFRQLTGDYRKIPDGYCRFGKLTDGIINQYLKKEVLNERQGN
jgi:uncharacterized protein